MKLKSTAWVQTVGAANLAPNDGYGTGILCETTDVFNGTPVKAASGVCERIFMSSGGTAYDTKKGWGVISKSGTGNGKGELVIA